MEHLAPEPDQCLPHLDVLRGFALFGILLVNFEWFSRSTQAMLLGSSSDLQGLDYRVTFVDFSFFWMPMVLGYFLFGRWLVESGIMERPDQHGPWMRRWQVRGLMLGLPASLAAMSLMRDAHLHLPDLQLTLGLLLYLVGSVGLSLAYLILVTRHAGRLQFLAPVGRMALTNYLLQSLFWTTIFYGYGFGWWGQIPRALHVPLALLFFTGQILWSRWWMARHHHGPMEWLWRVLTRLGRQSRKPGEHKNRGDGETEGGFSNPPG